MEQKVRPPRVKPGNVLSPGHMRKVEEYIDSSVPEKHKIATRRALLGQMGKSLAVKQKCLSCCNFSKEDVKNCSVVICPLNPYRPYAN